MAKDLTPPVIAWLNEKTGAIVHEVYAASLRNLDKRKASKLTLDALAALEHCTPLCRISEIPPSTSEGVQRARLSKLLYDVLDVLPDYTDGRNDKLVQRIKKARKELDAGTTP